MSACAACGTDNRPGAKFCGGCGAALTTTCPSCGAPAEPGLRFCTECGAALGDAPPAATARPAAAAERRLVSVLFADLVGFTTLSETRDAEEVRELLSRYFDTCRRLIALYGGTVEKFIGDAVMAVWGTPVATEDDAERAVRAALDLVAAVSALGSEVGAEDLRARAGVLTGEAAVTLGAAGEGMVAGDLVNTASRVQSVAEPGQVLVGESTRRASEQTIVYAEAGSHELKGKTEPVTLWRAVRVISGRQGAQRSVGLEAPFVGRDRELRLVKELFHASADEQKAHLVSITGIAGIGKSRLAWEFYKYFDGLADTVYWHRGRCLAYGDGVTYWALADMVRMRLGIAEDDDARDTLRKLQAGLTELILDDEERRFVEPRLAQLLGVGEHEVSDRQDLFAAWRLFFERLANTYPTLLVFEDLQWADSSLLDFVEYLLEWSRSSPIFVVTLARPELAERRANWGAALRNFSSLYLEPLSAGAMTELLEGLVPGLPPELRERILARAEGVPLYAVETVRMLVDKGLLAGEGAVYRLTGPVTELDVPETLHGLIASRLDGLAPEERRLLQSAAVLGKSFTLAGAAAVAERAPTEVEPLLTSLVRKEVLSLQSDPRSPERGQYVFLQDLVRHVALETLSRRERRALHLAAAAHIETAYAEPEEVVEVLASHYLDALAALPDADDAEAIAGKAHAALNGAADRAESLGALDEARRYVEQALALAPTPEARATLHERAGELAFASNALEAAEAHAREAISTHESTGDTHAAARINGLLARSARFQGRFDEAQALSEAAFAAVANDEPDPDIADLALALASIYLYRGDLGPAAERLEFGLTVAEAVGSPELLARGFVLRSQLAMGLGRPEESLAFLERGLAIALENDLSTHAGQLRFHLSDRAFHADRYEDALVQLREALALSRRRGDRRRELAVLAELTYPLAMLGRWDEALATYLQIDEERILSSTTLSVLDGVVPIHIARGNLTEARRLYELFRSLESAPDMQDRSSFLAATAWLHVADGAYAEALRVGLEADAAARQGLGRTSQASKHALVAALESAVTLGERKQAQTIIDEIHELQPGLTSPYLVAQAHRFQGRLDGSATEFEAAEAGFRELGLPFWLAVTLLEHGEQLATDEQAAEAVPMLEEARATFSELGATALLDRTDALAFKPRPVKAGASTSGYEAATQ